MKTLAALDFDSLIDHIEHEKVAKNKTIFSVNSDMKYVYIIDKGAIKLSMYSTGGRTLVKDISYDGEIFGENIFSPEQRNLEYAETLTDTGIFKIPIEVFKKLIIANPRFAEYVMNMIVQKLQKLEERLQNFVFRKAKERIIDFICKTGKRKGVTIGISECLIDHGMSHSEISCLTDTSRQTVARILNDLKKENHIHFTSRKSGKILVRDIDKLQTLAFAS